MNRIRFESSPTDKRTIGIQQLVIKLEFSVDRLVWLIFELHCYGSFTRIAFLCEKLFDKLAQLTRQKRRGNFLIRVFNYKDSPGDGENVSIILNGVESELKFITDSTGDKVRKEL